MKNNCTNRFKCVTSKFSKGSFCNKGKRVKFTYYMPKGKALRVRGIISRIYGGTFDLKNVKVKGLFNKDKSHRWIDSLRFERSRMRLVEAPKYCEECPIKYFTSGGKKVGGRTLPETTF